MQTRSYIWKNPPLHLGRPTTGSRPSPLEALLEQHKQFYCNQAILEFQSWFNCEPKKGITFTDSTPQWVEDRLPNLANNYTAQFLTPDTKSQQIPVESKELQTDFSISQARGHKSLCQIIVPNHTPKGR